MTCEEAEQELGRRWARAWGQRGYKGRDRATGSLFSGQLLWPRARAEIAARAAPRRARSSVVWWRCESLSTRCCPLARSARACGGEGPPTQRGAGRTRRPWHLAATRGRLAGRTSQREGTWELVVVMKFVYVFVHRQIRSS
jgi:hypothetical protein